MEITIKMSSNWLKLVEPGLYGTDLGLLYQDCKEKHLDDFKYILCRKAEKVMDEILSEPCIAEIFGNCYTSDVIFESPRYYNYESDWLNFNLTVTRYKIFKYWRTFEPWDKETFFKWAKEKYGSRDGFISFFPYEPRDFEVALATEAYQSGRKFEMAVGMLYQYALKINEIDLDAYQQDFETEVTEEVYNNDWLNEDEDDEDGRIFCGEDLEDACIALDIANIDYDLDSGDRIISSNMQEAISVLEEEGIDFDYI